MNPSFAARILIIFAVALVGTGAYGQEGLAVQVDGESLALAVPEGFAAVSDDSPNRELEQQFVPPGQDLVASFMPVNAREGLLSESARSMTILRVPVPGLDFKDATLFSQLKDLMRTQFDVMIESEDLREQISALASDATEDISTEMNRDLRLSFGEIVSLGVFDESPESIGYVTLNGVAVEVDGERTEVVQVMAGQFVLVRAKVLNFFVYSILRSKDDIDWAKKTSASWVRATLDLNRPE